MNIKSFVIRALPALTAVGMPILAFAQAPAPAPSTDVDKAVARLQSTIGNVTILLLAIATLVFIWGVIQFITSAGDPTKRGEGRQLMLWGIIALAVIAAAWAIANVLVNYFLTTQAKPPFFGAPTTQL